MTKNNNNKYDEGVPIKLAQEHWLWLQTLLGKIYIDSFIHGYKHGYEDCESKHMKLNITSKIREAHKPKQLNLN